MTNVGLSWYFDTAELADCSRLCLLIDAFARIDAPPGSVSRSPGRVRPEQQDSPTRPHTAEIAGRTCLFPT